MRPTSKKGKRLRKAISGAPVWLQTVSISKKPRALRIAGTFGPAGPVTIIRPGEDA